MEMKEIRAIVVMRAQPAHRSHLWLIREALKIGPRVTVVLGSCFAARSPRNPFSGPERQAMIRLALTEDERSRVDFAMVRDYYNDARWAEAVKRAVQRPEDRSTQYTLVGHEKDSSSAYLRLFPGWHLALVPRHENIDATTIREVLYTTRRPEIALSAIADLVDPNIAEYLAAHLVRPEWDRLRAEREKYLKEADAWGPSPGGYERYVLCADALIEWEDEVLLIRRGLGTGEGQLALVGGHVDPAETTFPAAIREAREETGLGLLDEEFERALVGALFLEAPSRSQRPGRIVSMLYRFAIKSSRRPVVTKMSREAQPIWFKKADLAGMEGEFFEDHFMALDHFYQLTV